MGFAELVEGSSPAPAFSAVLPPHEPPPVRHQYHHSTALEPVEDTHENASLSLTDTHNVEPPGQPCDPNDGPIATSPEHEFSFEEIQPSAQSWLTPSPKHSTQGIIATVGAMATLIALLIAMSQFQSMAVKIRLEHSSEMNDRLLEVFVRQRLAQVDRLRTLAKLVCVSSAVLGLIWSGLSFRSMTRRFWSIVGCAANGVVLIWILFA
jgi:hypothetical protein